jgi:hypothetical protein
VFVGVPDVGTSFSNGCRPASTQHSCEGSAIRVMGRSIQASSVAKTQHSKWPALPVADPRPHWTGTGSGIRSANTSGHPLSNIRLERQEKPFFECGSASFLSKLETKKDKFSTHSRQEKRVVQVLKRSDEWMLNSKSTFASVSSIGTGFCDDIISRGTEISSIA